MNKSIYLYDFLQVRGGAESVALQTCRHFENLDLMVSFVNRDVFKDDLKLSGNVFELTKQTKVPGWLMLKTSLAFERKANALGSYQNVIFAGSNAPLAVGYCQPNANKVYYCHTPPRVVYDLKQHYLDIIPTWQRPLLRSLVRYVQPRYERALSQMDTIFCNSKNVQQRLKKYTGFDSEVVYPPCETERFKWIEQGDYFVSTARLEPYKRVDRIVEAFKKMPDRKLIVLSGGSQMERLKQLAAGSDNIQFTGWVSERRMAEIIGGSLATLYMAKDEDFGMSPVESMGAGKPVIAVNEGGLKESVVNGVTGWLLDLATPEHIRQLVSGLSADKLLAMRDDCEARARMFNKEYYFKAIQRVML